MGVRWLAVPNEPSWCAPHLVVQSGTTRMSVEDLCRYMRRGLLVLGRNWISADQQFSSGSAPTSGTGVFEIAHGEIVGRIGGRWEDDMTMQFSTTRLLK